MQNTRIWVLCEIPKEMLTVQQHLQPFANRPHLDMALDEHMLHMKTKS